LFTPHKFSEIARALTVDDFTDDANRTIFGAMLRLDALGHPVDITLLVGELRDFGEYSADRGVCAATLANLYRNFPMASNLSFYVARLLEVSRRRRGLEQGIELIQAAYGGNSARQSAKRRVAL
jgi:replicative DNA helicase